GNTSLFGRAGGMAGAAGLQGVQITGKCPDKVYGSVRTGEQGSDGFRLAGIETGELHLPELCQRLQPKGMLGIACGEPQPGAAGQQILRDMRAKQAAATEKDYQFAVKRIHVR